MSSLSLSNTSNPRLTPASIDDFLLLKDGLARVRVTIEADNKVYDLPLESNISDLVPLVKKLVKIRESREKEIRKEKSREGATKTRRGFNPLALKGSVSGDFGGGPSAPASPHPTSSSSSFSSSGPLSASNASVPPVPLAASSVSECVYGVPLQQVMDRERLKRPNAHTPLFVEQAMSVIIKRGLIAEGIFRLSGTQDTIMSLKDQINHGKPVDLQLVDDIHDVSGLLKLYIRELPDPLLSYDHYDAILAIMDLDELSDRVAEFKRIISLLPRVNQLFLIDLIWFLNIVGKNSEFSKMSHDNLGRVIGPNILKSRDSTNDLTKMQLESDRVNSVCSLLFQNYVEVFEGIALPTSYSDNPALVAKFFTGHKKSIQTMVGDPELNVLWTADSSGSLRTHELQTHTLVKDYNVNNGTIFSLCLVGPNIWVGSERALTIHDKKTLEVLKVFTGFYFSIGVEYEYGTTNPKNVWVGGLDKTFVYDPHTFEIETQIPSSQDMKTALVSVPDAQQIWMASNKTIVIYNTESRTVLKEINVHSRKITSLTLINGKVLSSAEDMKLILWDPETLESVRVVDNAHKGKILGVTYFPQAKSIFTCSWDCVIKVWDSESLEQIKELPVIHSDAISNLVLVQHSEGRLLISASWDKFVAVWRFADDDTNSLPIGNLAIGGFAPAQQQSTSGSGRRANPVMGNSRVSTGVPLDSGDSFQQAQPQQLPPQPYSQVASPRGSSTPEGGHLYASSSYSGMSQQPYPQQQLGLPSSQSYSTYQNATSAAPPTVPYSVYVQQQQQQSPPPQQQQQPQPQAFQPMYPTGQPMPHPSSAPAYSSRASSSGAGGAGSFQSANPSGHIRTGSSNLSALRTLPPPPSA